MRRSAVVLSAALLVVSLAPGAAAERCGVPAAGEDGWPVASPASVGVEEERLCALVKRFEDWDEANLHAVVVIRHGRLIFEQYFTGVDRPLGAAPKLVSFNASMRHDLRSVSKSVVSLALGAAIGRGWIAGVDQPVFASFPDYADLRTREKERITLRHLLTMSAGLAWDQTSMLASYHERVMFASPDPYRYVLEQPVVSPPGVEFLYSSGSTAVAAEILRRATGRPIDDLARELLFEPLGIADVEWMRYPANGDPAAPFGLRMRPRDMAKLGELVLRRGLWGGRRIVPASWIDLSTSPLMSAKAYGQLSYGYQFWGGFSYYCPAGLGHVLQRLYGVCGNWIEWTAGIGLGGQRLYVVPSLDLVVVVNAGLYGALGVMQGRVPQTVLDQYVLQAVGD